MSVLGVCVQMYARWGASASVRSFHYFFSSSKIRINQIKAIYKINISINALECVGLEQNSDDDTPTRLMKF